MRETWQSEQLTREEVKERYRWLRFVTHSSYIESRSMTFKYAGTLAALTVGLSLVGVFGSSDQREQVNYGLFAGASGVILGVGASLLDRLGRYNLRRDMASLLKEEQMALSEFDAKKEMS